MRSRIRLSAQLLMSAWKDSALPSPSNLKAEDQDLYILEVMRKFQLEYSLQSRKREVLA